MNKMLRKRILNKIAQAIVPNDLPTAQVTETKTVSGSPSTFIATDNYPSIIRAFNSKNIPVINGLTNLLNQSLYYMSNGKITLPWMKSNNFNFGTSDMPSVELKNLMEFCKQVYKYLYTNNGTPDEKQLSVQEIAARVDPLKSSIYLNNLPPTNPVGQLATKINGNIKILITNYLLQIK